MRVNVKIHQNFERSKRKKNNELNKTILFFHEVVSENTMKSEKKP